MRAFTIVAAAITAVGYLPARDADEYTPDLPKDSKAYTPTEVTQYLDENSFNGGPFVSRTLPVKIAAMKNTDWHQSGGMHGIKGVTSVKYKNKEGASRYAAVPVKNEFGAFQQAMGIVRTYPDGTRFDDVLYYKGKVFEHRVRRKEGGEWSNSTAYKEPANYPPGYTGLKRTCASCHNQAGTGGYGADGLTPGGDSVFSDALDWSVVPGYKAPPTTKTVIQTIQNPDGTLSYRIVTVPADYVVGSGVSK